jgi:type IV pilus assembly protein PilN
MYDININFLKDRKLDAQTAGLTSFRQKKATPLRERLPILIGSGVAVGLIGLVGGGLLLLNNQKSNTQKTIAQLEAEIQRLQGQSSQIQQIQTEIDAVNQEIGILASVFNQIKPWSAILLEIGSITPPQVQIQSLTQSAGRELTITGTADSYEDVNDFLLSLKNSRFLDWETTRLSNSNWIENPSRVALSREALAQNAQPQTNQSENQAPSASNAGLEGILPQVVSFNIVAYLNDEPSQELISLLNRRGAIGLVTRLNTLQRKGALDIEPIVKQEEPEGDS